MNKHRSHARETAPPLPDSGRRCSTAARCVLALIFALALLQNLSPGAFAEPTASPAAADSPLELMLKVAGQADPQTRREAALAILKAGSPDGIKALVAIMESGGYAEAKLAICEALGESKLQPPAFVPALLSLVSQKEPALRRAAIAALNTYRDPAVVDKLRAAIQEQEAALLAESHAGLMKALYECTAETDRGALVLAWLKQPVALERLTALEIAQQAMRKGTSDPAILEQTRVMLSDPNEGVRQRAVLLLRTCGLREDSPRIEAMLSQDQPASVREAIYNALGLLGDPKCIPTVAKGLDDSQPNVAAESATALGWLGTLQPSPDPALVSVAVEALLAKGKTPIDNPKLRERVIDAMAGIADPKFLDLLARHAQKDEAVATVRQAAVRGLGNLADPHQTHLVLDRLRNDTDVGVREAAAEAIGKLGTSPEHLAALRERLDPKTESAAGVQTKAWAAYLLVFARLPWNDQRAVLESWSSTDSAIAARRIELLMCLEKNGGTARIDAGQLAQIREQLGDALIAANRPADAAAVLARQLDAMVDDRPHSQARVALKLVDSYLRSDMPDKALAAAASLQQPMARDAVAARLLRFAELTAETDGTAALVFLDKLRGAVPDQFGASWAARFRAVRLGIRPTSRSAS